MTFSRAKPTGWTDDIDTITASQINQIDTNQSRAVDGAAGGLYTPSPAIDIVGLNATTQNLFIRGAQSQHPLRVDSTTITDVAASLPSPGQVLDITVDVYYVDGSVAATGNWTLTLAVGSSAVAPVNGTVVRIVRFLNGAFTIDIESEGGASNPVATIPAAPAGAPVVAGSPFWADLWFDSSVNEWRILAISPGVSP